MNAPPKKPQTSKWRVATYEYVDEGLDDESNLTPSQPGMNRRLSKRDPKKRVINDIGYEPDKVKKSIKQKCEEVMTTMINEIIGLQIRALDVSCLQKIL